MGLKYNLEELRSGIEQVLTASNYSNIDISEIEYSLSVIDRACDYINYDLAECDAMLKDGETNLKKVNSIAQKSVIIDSKNRTDEIIGEINIVMKTMQANIDELHLLRRWIEIALRNFKSILMGLLSDESTDRQKVLTLYRYNLKPMHRLTYTRSVSDTQYDENNYSYTDNYTTNSESASFNSDTNSGNNSYYSLSNSIQSQYAQTVSDINNSNNPFSQATRGTNGDVEIYSLRKKNTIPEPPTQGRSR